MRNFGVIGFPIKHSFSPIYFTNKFKDLSITDSSYSALELEDLDSLKQLIIDKNLVGFNVTMPHKQGVLHHLDFVSHDAISVNAVNTVKVIDGELHGHNTDLFGFRNSLTPLLTKEHSSALIFGTGGSSAAVRYVLNELGIVYKSVSRKEGSDYTYNSLTKEIISETNLLINTTPLGMKHRLNESVDIPFEAINNKHLCYDLIYTPSETMFLKKCKEQGAVVKNGLQMLELQADKSWEIWNM
jgi:shikimate dehydrogenase